jgi:hypothetical protein
MTTVYDQVEFVQASATTSQHLFNVFARNSAPPKSFQESVPKVFYDFGDIFSKESFDELLEHKPWDHAIELELGAKVSSTKVYPLSPNEQKQSMPSLGEPGFRTYLVHQITYSGTSLLHQEEGWVPPACSGLPGIELQDN